MTQKLTAKLSDGREFEVCSTWHAKEDNYIMIVCRPPKEKQAREWWEVRRGNSFSLVHSMHSSYEMAILGAGEFDRGEYLIVHVREVLG